MLWRCKLLRSWYCPWDWAFCRVWSRAVRLTQRSLTRGFHNAINRCQSQATCLVLLHCAAVLLLVGLLELSQLSLTTGAWICNCSASPCVQIYGKNEPLDIPRWCCVLKWCHDATNMTRWTKPLGTPGMADTVVGIGSYSWCWDFWTTVAGDTGADTTPMVW